MTYWTLEHFINSRFYTHTHTHIHEERLLVKEFQRTAVKGTLRAQAAKGNINIAVILRFYDQEEEMVIRYVTNNDVQKRRETSSALP